MFFDTVELFAIGVEICQIKRKGSKVDLMLKVQEVFPILRVEEHKILQVFGHFLLINQLKCNYIEQILYYD